MVYVGVSFISFGSSLKEVRLVERSLYEEIRESIKELEIGSGPWRGAFANRRGEEPSSRAQALKWTFEALDILSIFNTTCQDRTATTLFLRRMKEKGLDSVANVFRAVGAWNLMNMSKEELDRELYYDMVLKMHDEESGGWKDTSHDPPSIFATHMALEAVWELGMWDVFVDEEQSRLDRAWMFVLGMADLKTSGGFRNSASEVPSLSASRTALQVFQLMKKWKTEMETKLTLASMVGLSGFLWQCQVQDGSFVDLPLGWEASMQDKDIQIMREYAFAQGSMVSTTDALYIREWMNTLLPQGMQVSWIDRIKVRGSPAADAILQGCVGGGRFAVGMHKGVTNQWQGPPELEATYAFLRLLEMFPLEGWAMPRWIPITLTGCGILVLSLVVPIFWVGKQVKNMLSVLDDFSLVVFLLALLGVGATCAAYLPHTLYPDAAYASVIILLVGAKVYNMNSVTYAIVGVTGLSFGVIVGSMLFKIPVALKNVLVMYLLRFFFVALAACIQQMFRLVGDSYSSGMETSTTKSKKKRKQKRKQKATAALYSLRSTWMDGTKFMQRIRKMGSAASYVSWLLCEFVIQGVIYVHELRGEWVKLMWVSGHWWSVLCVAPVFGLGALLILSSWLHEDSKKKEE